MVMRAKSCFYYYCKAKSEFAYVYYIVCQLHYNQLISLVYQTSSKDYCFNSLLTD